MDDNEFNDFLTGITVMSNQVKKILIDNGVNIPITVSGLGVDHLENSTKEEYISLKANKFKHIFRAGRKYNHFM